MGGGGCLDLFCFLTHCSLSVEDGQIHRFSFLPIQCPPPVGVATT